GLLELHCLPGRADVAAMETEYAQSGCWAHFGHHTYFTGPEVRLLGEGTGRLFVVEQQLAPTLGIANVTWEPMELETMVPIEISLDGRTWTRVTNAQYLFLSVEQGLPTRQSIQVDFDGGDQPFRYLRAREPMSVTQGLSGYLDHSRFTIEAPVAATPAPGALTQGERSLSCQDDILEDIFSWHPCTFGFVHHWDAPSWFHTYPLGAAELDRVSGTVTAGYFRPDDPGICCAQTLPGVLDGDLWLQTSVDGVSWTTRHVFPSTYGLATSFDVALPATEAAFIRLVSAPHPGFYLHPALKHPEAYLVYSALELEGRFATGGTSTVTGPGAGPTGL
ncbi:MAG: hypothetical protein ACPGQL_10480, partial [Thermoplasmatota archaeon]